eukprot:GILK01008064.1.p1 GENE.GILK01008064.1~~GILK01008064.1.p1  ORF type:complete len:289 (+),score=39.19 GILK01008064.1:54-920(+)
MVEAEPAKKPSKEVSSLSLLCIKTIGKNINRCSSLLGIPRHLVEQIAKFTLSKANGRSQVSSTCIKLFGQLDLCSLHISLGAQVNDSWLDAIVSHMASLERLELVKCDCLTDRGVSKLQTLSRLQYLSISGNPHVTDLAIKSLPRSLQVLNISGCAKVTDVGLAALLPSFKKLKILDIRDCAKLSTKHLAVLNTKVPRSCKIFVSSQEALEKGKTDHTPLVMQQLRDFRWNNVVDPMQQNIQYMSILASAYEWAGAPPDVPSAAPAIPTIPPVPTTTRSATRRTNRPS